MGSSVCGERNKAMPWTDLLGTLTPSQLAERLKNYWTAIGIVSALGGSMAFSAATMSPPECATSAWPPSYHDTCAALRQAYSAVMSLSLLCAGMCVICSTIFYAQLNQLPESSSAFTFFIDRFQKYFGITTLTFEGSFLSLLVGLCIFLFLLFGFKSPTPYIVAGLTIVIVFKGFRIFIQMQKCAVDLQKEHKERPALQRRETAIRFRQTVVEDTEEAKPSNNRRRFSSEEPLLAKS